MLRNRKNVSTDSTGRLGAAARWASVGVLAVVGLAVVGLRGAAEDVAPDNVTNNTEIREQDFGPIIERVVGDDSDRIDMFLDFETGKLFTPPRTVWPEIRLDKELEKQWTRKRGIDVSGETALRIQGLVGYDMITVPTASGAWQKMTPQLLATLNYFGTPQAGSFTHLSAKGKLSETFLFKTREGSRGVLQITGFQESPNGIKIRYKLLKQVGAKPAAPADVEEQDQDTNAAKSKFNFSYVPDDAAFFVAVRTAEIFHDDRFQPLLKTLEYFNRVGISCQQMEQFTLAAVPRLTPLPPGAPDRSPPRMWTIIHLKDEVDLGSALHKSYQAMKHNGQEYFAQPGVLMAYWMPNKRTIVGQRRPELLKFIDSVEQGDFKQIVSHSARPTAQALLVVNDLTPFRVESRRDLVGGFPLQMISPLLESADKVVVGIDVLNEVGLYGSVTCKNAEDANRVVETLEAIRTLGNNILSEQIRASADQKRTGAAKIRPLLKLVQELITVATVQIDGHLVLALLTNSTRTAAARGG